MTSGKGGYPSNSTPEPELTAKKKRQLEVEALQYKIKYLEDQINQLNKDQDKILQQLSKRDYDCFKTLPKSKQEDLLQQLRAVDYDRFKNLVRRQNQVEKQLKDAKK